MNNGSALIPQKSCKERFPKVSAWLQKPRMTTHELLDWSIGFVERLVVLGAMLLTVFVVAALVCANYKTLPDASTIARVVRHIHENWRAFIVIFTPLFYRVIRKFLEEIDEAFGMKRKLNPGSESQDKTPPQPPTRQELP